MKQYIEQTSEGIKCIHPKVKKVWQWGGGPVNGPFDDYLSIIMEDDTHCEFKSKETTHVEQCNNFLNTIPE